MKTKLTISPILFHWPAEKKRDFYFKIADEAPVDTVYLGEVVCSKRMSFFEPYYAEVTERLENAGKKVIFSTLSEVMLKRDRKSVEGFCEIEDREVEVNDTSALWHISGKPHRIGQYMNVYNEETIEFLSGKGATHFTLPAELPSSSIKLMAKKAKQLKVGLEVQVFGRVSLALSARCYHARAHDRIKDNCEFVCEKDEDGMELKTLDKKPFLSVNGIQTLSYNYLNLINELEEMKKVGVSNFRLSPHTQDMVEISKIFRNVLDNKVAVKEAEKQLGKLKIPAPFSNGFFHGESGCSYITKPQKRA